MCNILIKIKKEIKKKLQKNIILINMQLIKDSAWPPLRTTSLIAPRSGTIMVARLEATKSVSSLTSVFHRYARLKNARIDTKSPPCD